MWLLNLYKGRLNRDNYWCCFGIWVLYIVFFASMSSIIEAQNIVVRAPIVFLWFISLDIFASSSWIRRFHDFNRSGWWCLLLLIPLIGLISGLVLLFIKGDQAENKYGKPLRNELDLYAIFAIQKKEGTNTPDSTETQV
jgi:uncharacterized membrane protein YhaH (DUF805 family)